jgi:hypothetical protein
MSKLISDSLLAKYKNQKTVSKKMFAFVIGIWIIFVILLIGVLILGSRDLQYNNQIQQTEKAILVAEKVNQTLSSMSSTQSMQLYMYMTRTAISLTQTAAPSETPRPTSTPDNRTNEERDFDNCLNSTQGVRYVILGEETIHRISLTLQNDTGGTEQTVSGHNYCRIFTKFRTNSFLYISGQITNGFGSVRCFIFDGYKAVATASSFGSYSIATCSVSK